MPWEKAFDEDVIVGRAMDVFWEKGYEPASMADLLVATGITRGSLYNAFGGKEALFFKTLEKYDAENRRAMLAELEAIDDPLRAMTLLFDSVVAETLADPLKRGCFLVNTAADLATHGEPVRALVRNGMRELEAFFRRCIEVGLARGQIPPAIEPATTAKGLMGLLVSIRVLGRGVFDEASLNTLAAQAQRLLR